MVEIKHSTEELDKRLIDLIKQSEDKSLPVSEKLKLFEEAYAIQTVKLKATEEATEEARKATEKARKATEEAPKNETLDSFSWLDAKQPECKLAYGGPCGKPSTKPRFFPKTVKKWEGFKEDVRTVIPASTGVRYSSDMLAILNFPSLENESQTHYRLLTMLHAVLIVHGKGDHLVKSLSTTSMSNQEDLSPEQKRVQKIATVPSVPDIVLKTPEGVEFLVTETKRTTFLRRKENEEVPDLVKSYNNYKTSGGREDEVHGLSILQLLNYMVKLKLRYAVLSTADISYFCRLVEGEEYYDCLEMSEGITWSSSDPSLKRALYYIVDIALKELNTYKRLEFGKGGGAVISTGDSEGMEESEEEKVEEDEAYRPSNTISNRSTRIHTRSRGDVQESVASYLMQEDTPASDLNLEATPFATGGWSGNVTRGMFNGQPVAVKLAPKGCDRGDALENEAIAYNELRQYCGKYIAKLIAHGTTNNGKIVYLATELIDGSEIGLKPLTQAVASAARSALRAVHYSGWVHGDIREDNILVVEGSVRLIDFGFAKPITSTAECDKEVEELERILKNVNYWNVHMEDDDHGNENRSTEVHKRKLLADSSTILHPKQLNF